MKTKQDLMEFISCNYDELIKEHIGSLLVKNVNTKYEYPDDADESDFNGYYFYYDVELYPELLDLVVEDDSPETLVFHLLYEVVYDEVFIHPISVCEMYHHYEDRSVCEYISIDLKGTACDGFSKLEIVSNSTRLIAEDEINTYRSNYSGQFLFDDYLLPQIYSEKALSSAATLVLERYYPDYSRSSQQKIDPQVLAKSMGLQVVSASGLKNNIEGIVFFDHGTYAAGSVDDDWENLLISDDGFIPTSFTQKTAVPGTIVLETLNAYPTRITNTLTHECMHWFLHRKPYLLQVLLGEEAPTISCRTNTRAGLKFGNYFERREWQASSLSPKVLLANHDVREEVVARTKEKLLKKEKILPDCIEEVITELSQETGLSRNGVAVQFKKGTRGYNGIFACCENHYIRPYFYKSDALKPGQTFDISEVDFQHLYESVEEFKLLIDSGVFGFVENHVCLISPETVTLTSKNIYVPQNFWMWPGYFLTDKARMHMDKYCLVFTGPTYQYSENDEVLSGAFRAITKADNDAYLGYANIGFPSKDFMELARKRQEDVFNVKQKLNGHLAHDLNVFHEWCGFNKSKVYQGAYIDKNTYNNLLSGKAKSMKVETAIKLCVGMQLPRELAECLLKAAHIELGSSPLETAYQFIIDHFTYEPLEKIDEFLSGQDLPVLGYA